MKKAIKKKTAPKVSDIRLPKDYDIRKDGTSQSLIGDFATCRQRYLFKVNRWISLDGQRLPLFGNFSHDVMERAYKKGCVPGNKLLNRWIDNYAEKTLARVKKYRLPMTEDDIETEADKCFIVFQEYFKYYADDFEDWEIVSVEGVFEVNFKGFTLRGKKDGKFRLIKRPSFVSLLEHKTKGRVEEDILEGVLNFDFQNLTYITADDIKHKGNLKNVLYNIIRNPRYKQLKGETWQAHLKRIQSDIRKNPEHFYIRYECKYDNLTKIIFWKDLHNILLEAEKFLNGELPCYMNRQACKTPFKCNYLDACASGNMVGYIQQHTWFPELEE